MPMLGTRAAGSLSGYGNALGSGDLVFNIASSNNVDLRAAAIAQGWDQSSKVIATVTGAIGGTSSGAPAFTISGSFPSGVELVINAGASITGKGGDGNTSASPAAKAGGAAMVITTTVKITNNGIIGGGGGGGGYFNGGGGAGKNGGSSAGPAAPTLTNGGSSAGGMAGGAAGSRGTDASYDNGGGGGGLGASGGDSTSNTSDADPTDPGGYVIASYGGGLPGAAVQGNANVTWITLGTIYGARNA